MPDQDNLPATLAVLLIEDFPLMAYASVIEPFRAANVLAEKPLYRWLHVAVSGDAVRASNGAQIVADRQVGDALDCDILFVVAGGDPARFGDRATLGWLRRIAATPTRIAGVSGAPLILARAGLLEGHRATIHWEHLPALRAEFPMLSLEQGLYVIDRRRMTCAGGTAGMDLAIELIERAHGHALAAQVSEWFIRTESRRADRSQRTSLRERYGISDDRVLTTLAEMEATVEEPRSREALAARAGVSLRQLERLFTRHAGATVSDSYLEIRLAQAAKLLRSTGLAVTAVGLACGFRSSSHFSRAFKARFGVSPGSARR